jgi:hypothetical protein
MRHNLEKPNQIALYHQYHHGLSHSACFVSMFKTGSSIISLVLLDFFFLSAYILAVCEGFDLDLSLRHAPTIISHMTASDDTGSSEIFLSINNYIWKVNSRSPIQEILAFYGTQMFNHYLVYKRPPLTPILSQIKPLHTLLPYF